MHNTLEATLRVTTHHMNLPFKIARRYLFAKKSTNAINVITGISVFGLALGAAALVLVLSVFNGFETLITGMMSHFNPDVKITATKGKTFLSDSLKINELRALEGVELVSETLEEIAFFQYDKSQAFGSLKGVDDNFSRINHIDSTVRDGQYLLHDDQADYAVIGGGIRNQLGVYESSFAVPLSIFMPKRGEVGALEQPFTKRFLYPKGAFVIQTDIDNQYVLTNLAFMRDLLDAPDEVSAWEIKLKKSANHTAALSDIRRVVGESKASALAACLDGRPTTRFPASILQHHPRVVVVADRAALSMSTHLPHQGITA